MCMRRELSPCSNTKKESLSFFSFPHFFFVYTTFFCDVPGESERASECTHPYKRKIEASVDGGWVGREGRIYIRRQGRKDYGVRKIYNTDRYSPFLLYNKIYRGCRILVLVS